MAPSGSYSATLRENARYAVGFWTAGVAIHFLPAIFGKFVLGFYAGRGRLLENPDAHLPVFRWLLWWGLAFGVLGNAVWVGTIALIQEGRLSASSLWVVSAQVPIYLGVIALAGFYLAGIVLLWRRPSWRGRLTHLVPVGRMALTNYLMHSLVYLAVFYGFGLSLLGQVGASFCLVFSVIVFAAQVVFSRWWLRRFRFGPAEWLWRSFTYGSRQPMRLGIRDVA